MPPKADQGSIIILDVGRNVSITEGKEKSFFEKAKECASRLIERKIMTQGNNLVGIILLGSKKTKTNMASQCENVFKHIEICSELVVPTWNMIRELPETTSTSKGDWVEALIVAADYYKNVASGFKLSDKKIILMTNFQSSTSMDDAAIEKVLTGFKEENFEVDVIGPDIYASEDKKMQYEIARQFVESTNGVTATFEHAMNYLLFHQRKIVKAVPWNVDLSIGPNIKIPVSAYIRITKDEPTIKWSKTVKDPVTSGASATEAIKKQKQYINPETQKEVDETNKITGYNYGWLGENVVFLI